MSASNAFTNRVFGCAIVKAINANFNADFSNQPRTLPDGRVYATDKALKYAVRHYLVQQYPEERIMYYKRLNQNMNPLTLADAYDLLIGDGAFDQDHQDRHKVLHNILSCLDIRLFGSTFAPKKGKNTVNLGVHGPVQLNHGINQYYEDGMPMNEIYSEQITAPFSTDNASGSEAEQTTIGRQSKLREGHYVYHYSINPQNLDPLVNLVNEGQEKDFLSGLRPEDTEKLKEALRLGVTYFDSSAKAGTDNELLLWVQLKPDSKQVLPAFSEMVTVTKDDQISVVDLNRVSSILNEISDQIEKIELYYLPDATRVEGAPTEANHYSLLTGKSLTQV